MSGILKVLGMIVVAFLVLFTVIDFFSRRKD